MFLAHQSLKEGNRKSRIEAVRKKEGNIAISRTCIKRFRREKSKKGEKRLARKGKRGGGFSISRRQKGHGEKKIEKETKRKEKEKGKS